MSGEDLFRVDLHGVVDLLSHHLYSSPRVFMRELLQNGVDAITARAGVDPSAPREISLEPPSSGSPVLRVTDTGVGLTADEMRDLLATVGRSSKRDEYSFARTEFLGQFGIGLLSCFMVADEIVVRSRSARTEDAETIEWRGRADGTYSIAAAATALDSPGTEVTLAPRRGEESWFDRRTIRELALHYGSLLPVRVLLAGREPRDSELLSERDAPWLGSSSEADEYCQSVFGFRPLDAISLKLELSGVRGLAFVLPMATNPAERPAHRVYLKRMLLAESVDGLLPDWAFFVRCVIDTTELRPTASREALFEDAILEETRIALGNQIKEWLLSQAILNPRGMARFLSIHRLGVMAMAAHDDELLPFVRDHIEFETTIGDVTMAEFQRTFDVGRFTATSDEFRSMAGIAAAHGVGLINAGHTYEKELLERLAETTPTFAIEPMVATDLTAGLGAMSSGEELAARPLLRVAASVLSDRQVDVILRHFQPATLPAIFLEDARAARRVIEQTALDGASDFWTGLLSAVEPVEARSTFVLNYANPLIRKLARVADDEIAANVVGGLYVQSLLQGRHPVPASDAALLSTSFIGLIDQALESRPDTGN